MKILKITKLLFHKTFVTISKLTTYVTISGKSQHDLSVVNTKYNRIEKQFALRRKMRREFILVLIGIICISTFSSMLSGYVQIDTDKVLLDTVVGTVGAGNFSYWQLGHTGPLLLELTSLSGDADLYVADTMRPSYETDKNNFSSVTCGTDMVNIPATFPRPIGIGVFGHWSHSVTEYSIQVFLDTSLNGGNQAAAIDYSRRNNAPERLDKDKKSREKRNEEENKPRFMKLLNVLDMIFEMFVL